MYEIMSLLLLQLFNSENLPLAPHYLLSQRAFKQELLANIVSVSRFGFFWTLLFVNYSTEGESDLITALTKQDERKRYRLLFKPCQYCSPLGYVYCVIKM